MRESVFRFARVCAGIAKWAGKPEFSLYDYILAIRVIRDGRFHVLQLSVPLWL
jgi:hypothetical protein